MQAASIRLFALVGMLVAPLAEAASFATTGRLFTPRHSHTATLLPNGRVLVAGGWSNGAVASAELYDPATGAWTVTGALAAARYSHTAVLLSDGKVLVAGGTGLAGPLGTAEIYDPSTGAWTATGALTARTKHTATLLQDGRVLVAGGQGSGSVFLASSQIFNRNTGVWTSTTGGLAVARSNHAAVLLPDGRVEVAGGFITGTFTESREVFDPATGFWSGLAALGFARHTPTATLLPSGSLLVTAGCCDPSGGNPQLGSAETANPATGAMVFTASLAEVRMSHTATLLPNGRVLVVGGEGRAGDIGVAEAADARTSAQVFDPAANAGAGGWSGVVNMSQARSKHTATLLPSGQVLVVGGIDPRIVDGMRAIWDPGKPLSSAEIYDDGTGSWTSQAYGSDSPAFTTATTLPDGRVLLADATQIVVYDPSNGARTTTAVAGLGRTSTLLPSGNVLLLGSVARLYNPALGSMAPLSLPPTAAVGRAVLLADGRVLVVGGAGADLFDPAANAGAGGFTPTAAMATPRTGHTATLLSDGSVLVAGGQNGGSPLLSAEIFDPAGNAGAGSWRPTGFLTDPRIDHIATLLPGGSVLVAGGRVDDISATQSSEIYDPTTGSWTRLAAGGGLYGQAAILLLNGKVLTLGGAIPFTYRRDGLTSNAAALFDPASRVWTSVPGMARGRFGPAAALLPDGRVFVAGGDQGFLFPPITVVETYEFGGFDPARRPQVTSASASITFGVPFALTGTKFRGDVEGGSGGTSSAPSNYPVIKVQALESGRTEWLSPDARANFFDEPMSLTVSRLPATLNPGYHLLSVVTGGVPSSPGAAAPKLIAVTCSVAITTQPVNQTVALGGSATFTVAAQGARRYQWRKDGIAIPGAVGPSYTTPPVAGADSGSQFSVVVTGACASATSLAGTLIVADVTPPNAALVSPNGGEYWLLSEAGSPANQQVVTWSMSDNVRICLVEVALLYSNDGGATYQPVTPTGGGLPATYGTGGTCTVGQAVSNTSLTYVIPTTFPSGVSGSLYKVRVRVTDHVGLQATALSPNPFYIVRPNPDSVKTLILSNPARLQSRQGVSPTDASALAGKLQELAAHPRVLGLVVDLNGVTDITSLYAAWDADPGSSDKANAVLFGCHAPLPPGCTAERNGIHDQIRTLLGIYSGVRYLVLAGDDRIIPFARLQDRTTLLSESNYPAGGDLTPTGTTVGRALAANKYLSDDPLAVADRTRPDELSGSLFLPDLAVGRLVETPGEMTTAIATFIGQDGVLDLAVLDPATGHKVLVTGYDFLSDSAVKVRERWKAAFGAVTPVGSLAPVDGSLVGGNWGLGSVAARVAALRTRLLGNAGARYGVMSLAGHATHYEEGVPGTDPFDIQGLPASDLYGTDACATPSLGAVDLAGGVVYAVGCHGGLAVAGSCATDVNHSLDLPQTMLARGVVSYVANTGYGWGLKFGIGYGERLVDLLTEEMTKGGTVVTGDAVRRTKVRYYLETPRYDSYDEKSLMQWTLYGLPMYAVKTGLVSGASATGSEVAKRTLLDGAAPSPTALAPSERLGKVAVARSVAVPQALPSYLTQLNLSFDFTAPGVYTKRGAAGDSLPLTPGCTDPGGCYYTLNGLVERASGAGDLPIQPYFIYDSRLSGTSQHGVLWKGGTYDEESGWKPVFGELQSNGGDGSNHGAAPRLILIRPTAPRVVPGADPETCRPSDLELNSLVVGAGEAAKPQPTDTVYSIERRYRTIDLEALYFNNTSTAVQNCDRQGPDLAAGPLGGNYHRVSGATVEWAVPATDASGVWRVVVVSNDNSVNGSGHGTWSPLELADDGTGTFRGSRLVTSGSRLTYVIQAVDNRGNVTWLDYVTASLPTSGVPLGVPLSVDATIVPSVTVSDFTPTFGVPGTTVVVTGTQFTGATVVTFGGQPAGVFVVDSPTRITATVPPAAVSGLVAVTAPLGTGTSASIFTVVAPPTVTSFTPGSGSVGTPVVITGTNFTGVTEVSFGGMPATAYGVASPIRLSATVPTGAVTGKIEVTTAFGTGTSATDFVVTNTIGTRFHTIAPCRIVDTRTADAPALSANVSRTFTIAGRCGIPFGAKAVSLNVTVTSPAAPGNVRLFAAFTAVPQASALNYSAGQTRGNNAIIPLSAGGELAVLCSQATGTTQVIVDLNGYFE